MRKNGSLLQVSILYFIFIAKRELHACVVDNGLIQRHLYIIKYPLFVKGNCHKIVTYIYQKPSSNLKGKEGKVKWICKYQSRNRLPSSKSLLLDFTWWFRGVNFVRSKRETWSYSVVRNSCKLSCINATPPSYILPTAFDILQFQLHNTSGVNEVGTDHKDIKKSKFEKKIVF